MAASGSVVADLVVAGLRFVRGLRGLLEPAFELGVAVVQAMFQRAGVDERIQRGVGLDKACVDEDLLAIDESGLDALPDDAHEETLEDLHAPASASFGEDAVVGDLGVDVIVQEPEPVQAEGNAF